MNNIENLSNLIKNKIKNVELYPNEKDLTKTNTDICFESPIQKVWLTLNRACNLKCKWCYAPNVKNASEYNMPFDLAKNLVDFSKDIGALHIILMGGEPTLYPDFFKLVEYIKSKGMNVFMITNGHVFKNKTFLENTINTGIDNISICVKAANNLQQIEITGTDSFNSFLKALENLKSLKGLKYDFTTIVSTLTVDNLEEFASLIAENAPNKLLSYRFCSPCITIKEVNADYVISRYKMIPKVVNKFEKAIKILGNNVEFRQSYPFCFWPSNFINKLKEENLLSAGCLLRSKKRNGITFDIQGNMILCNWFHAYPLAQYGKDFRNKAEFEKLWNSLEIKDIYKELQSPPDNKCERCVDYEECKGGCFVRWLSPNGMKN